MYCGEGICPEEGRPLDADDDELVERARQGDVDAFTALVDRHQRLALRVAYTVVGAEAEDAVQDAFIKAYRGLPGFRRGAPFRPWLLRIVTNESLNRRRSAGRRAALALRVAAASARDGAAPSPEDTFASGQRREALLAAVAALPDADRAVIALRWFAGLSEREMADALGCRPGTVKSRLSRATGRLRASLTETELV